MLPVVANFDYRFVSRHQEVASYHMIGLPVQFVLEFCQNSAKFTSNAVTAMCFRRTWLKIFSWFGWLLGCDRDVFGRFSNVFRSGARLRMSSSWCKSAIWYSDRQGVFTIKSALLNSWQCLSIQPDSGPDSMVVIWNIQL